jgi:hypothetical protein
MLQAQIQKGNVMIGADIANFDIDLGSGQNFRMTINPKAAWFIQDNAALGGYLKVGISTAKDAGTDASYGVGLLGRYYISDKNAVVVKKSRFFFEGNVGVEGDNPAVGDNTNGLGIGIGPGFAYFLTPNIGLETLLKYNGIVGFGSSATSNHLNLNIGFQMYLPGKKLREEMNNMKK